MSKSTPSYAQPNSKQSAAAALKLKHQLRNCMNCCKAESDHLELRDRFKLALYCGTQCQKMDWSRHKHGCNSQTAQSNMAAEIDEMAAGLPVILPMQSVQTLFVRCLLYVLGKTGLGLHRSTEVVAGSLNVAKGVWNLPSSEHPIYDGPQVLIVKLSPAPGNSTRTKGRAAFRVVTAQLVPFSELRIAAVTPGHQLCNLDMQHIVDDCDSQLENRLYKFAGISLRPYHSLSMVIHRLDFHNGVSAMAFYKHWYLERDIRADYTQQWRPPSDDWLDFLKTTVAAGKGWDRDDSRCLLKTEQSVDLFGRRPVCTAIGLGLAKHGLEQNIDFKNAERTEIRVAGKAQ
ncbi:hypothetical protein C8R47DRAFT_1081583 [Mycena vitilis]|nr:hypothetical protein C8R47DRAFT_1081583 [Mycena vitilis]